MIAITGCVRNCFSKARFDFVNGNDVISEGTADATGKIKAGARVVTMSMKMRFSSPESPPLRGFESIACLYTGVIYLNPWRLGLGK